jgi:biotin carboxylase
MTLPPEPGREPAGDGRRPLLLVIATGPQEYREYLFSSLHHHYRIHLLHIEPASWERPYITGSGVVADFSAGTLIAAARRVAAREPVAGVLCWDEARIHATAHVAQVLGLPGGDPEAIERCRDKYLGRMAMATAGVRQPAFALVGTVEEALAAAQTIGYPAILKPRAAAASYGVVLVRDPRELAARFAFAHGATVPEAPRHPSPVLVEEFVRGPEISVDSVVARGAVTPVFVARKGVGFPPFFEETQHVVRHPEPLLDGPALREAIQSAHSALGFRDGWTHAEFKLTDAGPSLIEVNARLGGDLIPYLGLRASGIDPGQLASAAACGYPVRVTSDRALVAGVRFLYPEGDDVLVESAWFAAADLPPEIDRAVVLVAPGSRVRHPPAGLVSGRIAFVTALASSPEACSGALDAAGRALRMRVAGGSMAAR